MSRNAIVYASRSRTTGALALTIDTRHPDVKDDKVPFKGVMVDGKFPEFAELKTVELRKRTKAEAQMRYAAYDVDHKVTSYFAEHYPAGRAIAHTEEWCTRCDTHAKNGTRITKAKPASTPAPKTPAKPVAKAPAKAKAKKAPAAKVEKPVEPPAQVSEPSGDADDDAPATADEIAQLAAVHNS